MLTQFAIAAGLIIAAGVIFLVLRGSSSPQPLDRKRQIKKQRERRRRARDSDPDDEEDDTLPDEEAISKWSDSN